MDEMMYTTITSALTLENMRRYWYNCVREHRIKDETRNKMVVISHTF